MAQPAPHLLQDPSGLHGVSLIVLQSGWRPSDLFTGSHWRARGDGSEWSGERNCALG